MNFSFRTDEFFSVYIQTKLGEVRALVAISGCWIIFYSVLFSIFQIFYLAHIQLL